MINPEEEFVNQPKKEEEAISPEHDSNPNGGQIPNNPDADVIKEQPNEPQPETKIENVAGYKLEEWSEAKVKRRTLIAFAVYAAAGATGIAGWRYFRTLPETDNSLTHPTRNVLSFDEKANDFIFSEQHLAPTYAKSLAAKAPRVNGDVGIDTEIDLSTWGFELVDPSTNTPQTLTLNDLKDLPKQEIVFDFKCIEGWNEIVHYGGVKLADFMQKFKLGKKNDTNQYYKYVGMETPDAAYYVGLDMKSAMHPQTLLCFEMNGEPLSVEHGAPLRLIIPVKYGVKNLKCIGKIFLSDEAPRDYWHEQGYVYDAAL